MKPRRPAPKPALSERTERAGDKPKDKRDRDDSDDERGRDDDKRDDDKPARPTKAKITPKKSRAGYVYVLTNRALKEDWVKIGRTIRPPEVRAAEISDATGVPIPYEVFHREWVSDCWAAERELHELLDDKRVNQGREFFLLSPEDARDEVQRVCRKYQRTVTARFQAVAKRDRAMTRKVILALELVPGFFFQTFGIGNLYAGGAPHGLPWGLGFLAFSWASLVLHVWVVRQTGFWYSWPITWLSLAVFSTYSALRLHRLDAHRPRKPRPKRDPDEDDEDDD